MKTAELRNLLLSLGTRPKKSVNSMNNFELKDEISRRISKKERIHRKDVNDELINAYFMEYSYYRPSNEVSKMVMINPNPRVDFVKFRHEMTRPNSTIVVIFGIKWIIVACKSDENNYIKFVFSEGEVEITDDMENVRLWDSSRQDGEFKKIKVGSEGIPDILSFIAHSSNKNKYIASKLSNYVFETYDNDEFFDDIFKDLPDNYDLGLGVSLGIDSFDQFLRTLK